MSDNEWLNKAQACFERSTEIFDKDYRQKIEDNLRHFQNKHHSASKYNKTAYTHRSKNFTPKTRSAVRSNEAAAATVFFSSQDFVSIEPRNPNNMLQCASAAINRELVNYRLSETIPWFVTCIGAFQDGQVVGAVASKQYWEYEEKRTKTTIDVEDEYGEFQEQETESIEVKKDQPCIDLIPLENIRFDFCADWRNIVDTSPYLDIMVPMYVCDIKEKMASGKWIELDDDKILACREAHDDTTRRIRRDDSDDDEGQPEELNEYDIIWVHEWFMRKDGEPLVFKTLANKEMVREPEPVEEQYAHGIPVKIGVTVIEAHKPLPESPVGLGAPVQKELNEVRNQRRDNVLFVLNKRWFVKRGAQVDISSIVRNVPGSATLMDNPHTDVVGNDFPDVTSSAYAEEDRINLNFDELVGNFSASSIQSNRKMNETVGGMNMLRSSVNVMTEYLLMTFSETWVEPVIKQLVKMEQLYETDEVVLALAYEKAQLQRFGMERVDDSVLNQNLNITVNVGIGATDPMTKLQKFLMGVNQSMQVQQMAAQMGPAAPNVTEIQKEIWGRLGYKDGARFTGQAPEVRQLSAMIQQLQQQNQQLQAMVQDKEADRQSKLQQTMIREQGQDKRKMLGIKGELEREKMETQGAILREQMGNETDFKIQLLKMAENMKSAVINSGGMDGRRLPRAFG